MSNLVFLGQVVRPHGVKGGLKIKVSDARPDRFQAGQEVLVEGAGAMDKTVSYTVKSYSEQGVFGILYLEECQDADQAESLRKSSLYVSRDSLPDLPDDRFYILDLEGLRVENLEGQDRGVVSSVMTTSANDVLVLHYQDHEVLIPFVKAFIRSVDLEDKVLVIKETEGLFDEN